MTIPLNQLNKNLKSTTDSRSNISDTSILERESLKDDTSYSSLDKDSKYEREKFENTKDFFLSVAGSFIGLGNVWRFPYLCYENGGAIFLIPYIIFLFLAGIPIFFLEMVIGQYTSQGGITVWNVLAPISTGIGIGSIVLTTILNAYYVVIIGWTIYYVIISFSSSANLYKIWATCDNSWNSIHCKKFDDILIYKQTIKENLTNGESFRTPVEEYWERNVLKLSDEMSLSTLTDIDWRIYSCVFLAWLINYFCVYKSLKWTAKIASFTATFPIIMLLVLLVRGITLDGAMKGLEFYLIPKYQDWNKLLETKIWLDAGTQVLFSYALCKGQLCSLGSYKKFRSDTYKHVYILSICNSGVSFISGFAIFSVLGFMSKQFHCSVADVAKSGPGLAFIAFPQAILEMPGKFSHPIWSVAFFFMIFLLGLDSAFVGLEATVTSIQDVFPFLRAKGRREKLLALIVIFSLLLELPMCASGGNYLFKLYDYYGASGFCLLYLSIAQCLTVSYLYGYNKIWKNVKSMIGYEPNKYCLICWMVITPAVCIILIFLKIWKFKPLVYKRPISEYVYSQKEEAFGWFLASLSIFPSIFVAIYKMFFKDGKIIKQCEFKENLKRICSPDDKNLICEIYGDTNDDLSIMCKE